MRELKIKSQTGRELLITKEEAERNASVTKQSTTKEFAKNIKETHIRTNYRKIISFFVLL